MAIGWKDPTPAKAEPARFDAPSPAPISEAPQPASAPTPIRAVETPARESVIAADLAIEGKIVHSDFLGSVIRARVDVGGQPVSVDMFNQMDGRVPQPGDATPLYFSPDDLLVLPK